MPSKCRSCGAEVLFVPSAKTGKLMILNAKPAEGGLVVVENGKARVVKKDELFAGTFPADAQFYTDHHATCPQAQQWRKSKVKDS